MKYIEIKNDIGAETISGNRIEDKDGNIIPLKFIDFVKSRLQDPKFGQSAEWLFAAFEINKKINSLNGESCLALETDHWDKLKSVTVSPSKEALYNPNVAHCTVPFIKAIIDAKDENPCQTS